MYLSPYFHIDWYEHPKLPVYDCTNYTQRNMTLRSFYQVNSDHWTSMNSRSRAIPSKLASEIQGPWQGGNWAEALRFLFFFKFNLGTGGSRQRVGFCIWPRKSQKNMLTVKQLQLPQNSAYQTKVDWKQWQEKTSPTQNKQTSNIINSHHQPCPNKQNLLAPTSNINISIK